MFFYRVYSKITLSYFSCIYEKKSHFLYILDEIGESIVTFSYFVLNSLKKFTISTYRKIRYDKCAQ